MVVLFPGAPLSVVGMTVAMEAAKLVTAGCSPDAGPRPGGSCASSWPASCSGSPSSTRRGVYAQLVAAHVGERGAAVAGLDTQDATLGARIEVAAHTVADLDRRLSQIDTSIEEAAKRGRTNAALSAIESQRKARAGLVDERNREAGKPEGGTCSVGR